MNKKEYIKLGDSDILIIDGDRGNNYPSKADFYQKEFCLFLDAKNITDSGFNFNEKHFINKEKDQKLRKGKLKRNDIVMMTRGSIGNVAIYDKSVPYDNIRINSGMVIFRCQKDYDAKFLYYMLKSHFVRKQINDLMSGSVQKQLPVSFIKEIKLLKPNTNINIGLISHIDARIKNNNKINDILGKMAKTIYDYYFLQFEFPCKKSTTYKASGGEMVWSEKIKGEIPKGWQVITLKDCIKHINTGLNPRHNFELGKGSIKYVTVKNLTTNGNIDFSGCDVIDEAARKIVHNRSNISKNDILFASIAPLGRCVIVKEDPVDWDINESVFCIRPDFQKVSTEYLYSYFMSDYFIKKAEHSSTGSIFSGIRITTLEEMPILIPNKEVIDQFTNQVSNLFEMKYNKEQENEKLISLRNFLLPLLMNEQVKSE